MFWFLSILFTSVQAAMFGVYSDAQCENLVIPVLAYSDVCTWNTYSTSYSLFLESCSSDFFSVQTFNLTDSPTCGSYPVNQTFSVSRHCKPTFDYYTKILDSEDCESDNNSYNIVAHNTPNCSDPGLPFSIVNRNNSCVGNSFGPGLAGASFDTEIYISKTTFLLEIFQSKDGSCQNNLDFFAVQSFGSKCVAPLSGNDNQLFLQIWQSFPLDLVDER